MNRKALILGVAGQDGTYLAELLIAKGYRVVGAARDLGRARAALPEPIRHQVELVQFDLRELQGFPELLARRAPDEIYNLAGPSSGAGMFDAPADIGLVHGLAVTQMLEAMRERAPGARFCQASSSEIFGETTESPQSETSPLRPRSPYGAAKVYAHDMLRIVRKRYGLYACSAILFNHESPRRKPGFVTRKVTRGAALIKLGLERELRLGNLEARRDWGFAGDTVRALWLALQAPQADDYVIATGETHSVRELCEEAFGYLGLDYSRYVAEELADFRAAEPLALVGNAAHARTALGWAPTVSFRELVAMMIDAEIRERT